MRTVSKSAWVLGALLWSGAPAWAADPFSVADSAPAPSGIAITDARPAKELKGGMPLMFDPTYSIPDARFTPPLLDVFTAALKSRVATDWSAHKVVIEHFQVQNYFRKTYAAGQSTGLFIAAGVAGELLAAIDKHESVDAVRIKIAGQVDGQPFAVEVAQPYEAGHTSMGMVYNTDDARRVTREVVEAGIAAAVEKIRAIVTPAVAQATTKSP